MNKEEFVKYLESNEFYQYKKSPESYVKDIDNELFAPLYVSFYKTGTIRLTLYCVSDNNLSLSKYENNLENFLQSAFQKNYYRFDVDSDSSFTLALNTKNIDYAKNWVDTMNNENNVRELFNIILDYISEVSDE